MKILYSALTEYFWMHTIEVVNNMIELGNELHVVGFLRSRPRGLHPSAAFYNVTLRHRGWREFCDPVYLRQVLRWAWKRLFSHSPRSFYECWLEDIMNIVRFDLVYERNGFSNPAIALASERGIPSILEFNGIWPLEAEWKGNHPSEIQRFKEQEVSAALHATRVVCVSEGARDYYTAQGVDAGKTHVIPNGANPDLFRPMDKRHSRERSGLGHDGTIIGFSGSLQNFYEIDCVIRALPLILKQVPDIRLVAVGRDYQPPWGPGRDSLRTLSERLGVAERVSLLDAVHYDEVPYYINSFDICLLPLVERRKWRAALSPLKLREYMSCGRPVVAGNIAGDVQVLREERAGLLYNSGDPQDLAEKVCILLSNRALAQRMGDSGRRYILERGTWRHVTERIMAVAAIDSL